MLCAGILAAWAIPAHAQAIGSIFGKVTDPSGAVLPGVTVTITGTGLPQPLVGTTTESGAYPFPSVPIGTSAVTFELANFKKVVRPNVLINTGFNAEVDQKLELGQMSEDDLKATYEYLSAIPCISHQNAPVPLPKGTPPLPSILYQTCPTPGGN